MRWWNAFFIDETFDFVDLSAEAETMGVVIVSCVRDGKTWMMTSMMMILIKLQLTLFF